MHLTNTPDAPHPAIASLFHPKRPWRGPENLGAGGTRTSAERRPRGVGGSPRLGYK
jgi:hypothetical protein